MRVDTVSSRAILRRLVGVVAGTLMFVGGAEAQENRIGELADRGRAERVRGEIDASIATFESARDLADETEDRRSSVILEGEIATTLSQAGRQEAALEILRRVEDRIEEFENDPEFAAAVLVHVRSDIATVLQQLGRLHDAVETARLAVDAVPSTGDPAARGLAYGALGSGLLRLGRIAEARGWLERAHDEFEELPATDTRRITNRMLLAKCAGELGDTDSALEVSDQLVAELEAFEAMPALVGSEAYDVRGQLRYYRDWSGAEEDLRRSLELLSAAGTDEDSARFQHAVLNLSHAIRNAGRPDESATLERGALSVLRDQHLESHPTGIRAAQFLAASLRDLYDRNGDRTLLDESRALLEGAARAARDLEDPNSAVVFALLGELYLDAFVDPDRAEPWLRAAVERIEQEAAGTLALDEESRAGLLERRRLRKRHDPYEVLLRCLVQLDRPDQALDVLERSRARSLADLLERSRSEPLRIALGRAEEAGDAEVVNRLRSLPAELDDAMAALARARTGSELEARRAREQLQRLEEERAGLTRNVVAVGKVATVDEIRSQLRKDEILLAYFLGRKVSYACVAEPGPGPVEWTALVDVDGRPLTQDEIELASRDWIDALGRGLGDPARGLTPSGLTPARNESMALGGHRLFRTLVPPAVWARLRGKAIVHLLPHGALNRLPFEALVVEPVDAGRDSEYWLDAGPAIAYQESGSAFVWSQRRRAEQEATPSDGMALILADPAYQAPEDRPDRSERGPVVVHVERGGPAAREGFWVGDRIVSLADTKLESVEDYQRILVGVQDPKDAACIILREGIERSLRLPVGDTGLEIAAALPPALKRGPGRSDSAPLERLPGTAREAQAVREALRRRSSVRLLTSSDATETLLTAWCSRASVLHIAAHQIPDVVETGASRLALTAPPFPTAEDDGYLDLDDLLIHWRGRLDRCGLVVLSSCWSRTGRLVRDEGFFGLPFGLRYAGCPSIVSSLWPVDDTATADLMSAFYEAMGIAEAPSRLDALRRAKQSLKRERPDPYYWAAFLWSGAPH